MAYFICKHIPTTLSYVSCSTYFYFKTGFLVSPWGPKRDGATNYEFIKL